MIKNYMDQFTHAIPDRYCDKKIDFTFSFTDELKNEYTEYGCKIQAGTKGTWKIDINVNDRLEKGDGFFLFIYDGSLGHEFQVQNKEAANHMSVEPEAFIELDHRTPGISNICRIFLKEDMLSGQSISITIRNAESYYTAGESYFFIEYYNGKEQTSTPVTGTPFVFEVVNRSELALLRVLGPTVAKLGDTYKIHIGAFDECGNLMEDYQKEVIFLNRVVRLVDGQAIVNVSFDEEKVYRLKIKETGNNLVFHSNPIVCQKDPKQFIYWGDLHAHGWGDKSMHLMHVSNKKISPSARHEQASNIGRFDFCAVGPMSYPDVDKELIWDSYKNTCTAYDKEGEYIPFLSYEAHPPTGGDRNIIFKYLDESIPPDYLTPMYDIDDLYNKRDDVFVECHIGGKTPKFEENMNKRERLVEAISSFGNAEWLLQKVLKHGFQPAVCGSSDLHYGLMGGPKTVEQSRGRFFRYFNKRDAAYGTGALTAVISKKLSRDSIWESLENRATYATNDDRIYMEFSVNDCQIGQEIMCKETYHLKVVLHGTDIIERIAVISGDYVLIDDFPASLDYENQFNISSLPSDYIYLKVQQKNGGFIISSPVYIKYPYQKWNESESSEILGKKNEASAYLNDVIRYLTIEEDISKFSKITPVDIVEETMTSCALFHAFFGSKKISIRWYFKYEVPRIRFDWGVTNTGNKDCEMVHNINNTD
ncbi:MAG: hypothetical protein JXQ23_08045 [Clostridia bacterium]|nr:hypothetical protein [Clostridia bacterium]